MEKMRGKELALDLLADVAGGFVQAVALHCFINNIDVAWAYPGWWRALWSRTALHPSRKVSCF